MPASTMPYAADSGSSVKPPRPNRRVGSRQVAYRCRTSAPGQGRRKEVGSERLVLVAADSIPARTPPPQPLPGGRQEALESGLGSDPESRTRVLDWSQS
jgi:hypothetical protein